MTFHLTIGNKAYSSWSLRPWILLTHFDIPFDETVIPLDQPETRAAIGSASPNGRVPVLDADGLVIPESLAIMEFVAEAFPDRPIWPQDRAARAIARALSSEIHAGFQALRQTCPTNFRREPKPVAISPEVQADIDRIETAWRDARRRYGQGGAFLFGAFSAADAMWAPVVNRFQAYAIEVLPETRAYMEAVMALPAWQSWIAGAKSEPWRIDRYDAL